MTPYVESGLFLDDSRQIEEHQEVLAELMMTLFGIHLDQASITQDMALIDLWGYWPRDDFGGGAVAHRGSRAQWASWVLTALRQQFGVVALDGVKTMLVTLLDDVAASRRDAVARRH